MSVNLGQILQWIEENRTNDDGVGLDYLTLNEPSSTKARSWREFASIRVGDRDFEQVTREVQRQVSNTLDSAKESNASEVAIKVCLYRMKSPAGSRVWREEFDTDTEDSEEKESPNTTNQALKLMAQQNTELKSMVMDLVKHNTSMATKGWELASKAMEKASLAETEANEIKILLAANEAGTDTTQSDIMKMGATLMTDLVKEYATKKMNEPKQVETKE